MAYDNTNSGALFKNDKKGNDKAPDYSGEVDMDGKKMRIAAWLETSKRGQKYFSLKLSELGQQDQQRQSENPAPEDDSSDLPF